MADVDRSRWRLGLTRTDRRLLLVAVAYLSAIVSLVSYTYFDGGTGTPGRLQMGLMALTVFIIYYLSVRSSEG